MQISLHTIFLKHGNNYIPTPKVGIFHRSIKYMYDVKTTGYNVLAAHWGALPKQWYYIGLLIVPLVHTCGWMGACVMCNVYV